MAFPTISDAELLARCTEVFRAHGFEGATMSRISAATGLEKGSLYHRFPKGKEQMATAVAQGVVEWFTEQVFDVLKAEGSPKERVMEVAVRLSNFYAGGAKACVLDALSISSGGAELAAGLMGALEAWLEAFAQVSRESGYDNDQAHRRAEDAIARIEGSLVVSRVLNNPQSFLRVMEELPDILIKPHVAAG